MYEPRFYRQWPESKDLISSHVQVSESDLYIRAKTDLSAPAKGALLKYRHQIESYIKTSPEFAKSLKPYPVEPLATAIIKEMANAGERAGVGPMAAVAGAVAEYVGRELLEKAEGESSPFVKGLDEIIVENGGDVFLAIKKKRNIGIYAGQNIPPIFIQIEPEQTPCGICTSSGKLGHSLSFGKADSVTIISKSCALADAAATATCNLIKSEEDLEKALDFAMGIEGVQGVLAVIGKKIGIKGSVKLSE